MLIHWLVKINNVRGEADQLYDDDQVLNGYRFYGFGLPQRAL